MFPARLLKKRLQMRFSNFLVLVSMLIILGLLATISMVLYNSLKSFIFEKTESNNITFFNQIYKRIKSDFDQLTNISNCLQKNSELVNYVNKYENSNTNFLEKNLLDSKIKNILLNYKKYSSLIKNIYLVTDGSQFSTEFQILDTSKIDKNRQDSSNRVLFYNFKNRQKNRSFYGAQFAGSPIFLEDSMYLTGTISGVNVEGCRFFIILDNEIFKEMVERYEHILILDRDGNVVYNGKLFNDILTGVIKAAGFRHKNDSVSFLYYKNSKVYFRNIDFYDCKICYVEEFTALKKQLNSVRILIILVVIITMAVSFLIAKLVSIKAIVPIKKLIGKIDNYKSAYMSVDSDEEPVKPGRILLRERLMMYFIFTIFIPVALYTFLFYVQSSVKINNEIKEGYLAAFNETVSNIDYYLYRKENILKNIASKRLIQEVLLGQGDKDELYDILKENSILGLDRDSIIIYDKNFNTIFSNNPFITITRKYDSLNLMENFESSQIKWYNDFNNFKQYTVGMVKYIRDVYSSSPSIDNIGYLNISIDNRDIVQMYSPIKSNYNDVFIMDRNSVIISHTEGSSIGMKYDVNINRDIVFNDVQTQDGRSIILIKKIKNLPWYLVSKYRYSDIFKHNNFMLTNIFYINIIVFFIAMILSYILSLSLVNPLGRLNKVILEVEFRNLDLKIKDNYYIDEIAELFKTFDDMTNRIEGLIDEIMVSNIKNSRLENEKTKAEINALQAQINPHFLYNTLEAINGMIQEGNGKKAISLVNSLSDLFRLGISKNEFITTIREEIQHAKAYANIMQLMYRNRFEVIWDIDENLLDFQIVKFILQPFIENAIYHGIKEKKDAKVINVRCKDKGEKIGFVIMDDGTGISEDELDEIMNNFKNAHTAGKGFGVYNVNLRMRLYYGDKYTLDIFSKYGEGTIVEFVIPKCIP